MSTLLHVSASPRGASSDSRALAGAFLGTHRQAHPDVAEIRWQPAVVTASRDADKAAALQRAAEAGRRF